jgi:hypothetical protein
MQIHEENPRITEIWPRGFHNSSKIRYGLSCFHQGPIKVFRTRGIIPIISTCSTLLEIKDSHTTGDQWDLSVGASSHSIFGVSNCDEYATITNYYNATQFRRARPRKGVIITEHVMKYPLAPLCQSDIRQYIRVAEELSCQGGSIPPCDHGLFSWQVF